MMDARTEELINAALDNELDAAEVAELDKILGQSAEARAYHASLQQLDVQLRALPRENIPAGLHEDISSAISLPRAPAKTIAPAHSWPGVVRYGLAASLGLAVAIGFYELRTLPPGSANYDLMTGTIAPDDSNTIVDDFSFEKSGQVYSGELIRKADSTVLEVRIESQETIDISIDLADTGLRFAAIKQMLDPLDTFSVAADEIRARGQGRQRFSVSFTSTGDAQPDPDARIRIEYSRDGKLIEQRNLKAR